MSKSTGIKSANDRLSTIHELISSQFTPNEQYSEEQIKLFEDLCNRSAPKSREQSCFSFVRGFYTHNKNGFLTYLKDSGLEPFIFWTDAGSIVHHFGVDKGIYLKRHNGAFVAEKRLAWGTRHEKQAESEKETDGRTPQTPQKKEYTYDFSGISWADAVDEEFN